MSAVAEYDWNAEFNKDKRLKEMKGACYQILSRLKLAEEAAKEVTRPKKTVPLNLESSSSSTDSDVLHKTYWNPMDEMSEYENDGSDRPRTPAVAIKVSDPDDDIDDESDKPCAVCHRNDNAGDSMFCDSCDEVYHTYCVGLHAVPEGSFFCPPCVKKTSAVLLERFMDATVSDLNDVLIHVATCPSTDEPCNDSAHKGHCEFYKNFLRCMSMLNLQIQGTKIAAKLASALGYHAAHCRESTFCNVPTCNGANRRKNIPPRVQPLQLDDAE
ncbi:hypothetical protein H310_01654 [Aphanomyces invadans]|uniref:PHD-type domain-containing protein n=1 Tax=Aphanomyces invadans TaxID=157072 RepID=A0A024UTG3_9STRA|nr:hypothetical protein H310_01654 [Aphanomyces invadans]ETW09255.1 hypothetical protein H310_01654 [Aphanomyces invadans]|eukprot:XP_008863060.1 hypothetical protein H310_01654 [Aphanomyces invadans]